MVGYKGLWKLLWRDRSAMSYIKTLGILYMRPGMTINQYETEKSHAALSSSLSKCLRVYKWYKNQIGEDFISISISNLTPCTGCSVHICIVGLMIHFSDFFS